MCEGLISVLLCIDIVSMETFGLHGLILYVFEGLTSVLLCNHNVGMGTFGLDGLI